MAHVCVTAMHLCTFYGACIRATLSTVMQAPHCKLFTC